MFVSKDLNRCLLIIIVCVKQMYKDNEKERKKNKKFQEIFTFINELKTNSIKKYSIRDFNKELILFFQVTDTRAIDSKIKILETLDLIEIKNNWAGVEVWIKD